MVVCGVRTPRKVSISTYQYQRILGHTCDLSKHRFSRDTTLVIWSSVTSLDASEVDELLDKLLTLAKSIFMKLGVLQEAALALVEKVSRLQGVYFACGDFGDGIGVREDALNGGSHKEKLSSKLEHFDESCRGVSGR
jgi:hypothetical protein